MLDYRIIFQSDVFIPGSQFNGFIYLNTDGRIKARKIDLKIVGHAETRWTENVSRTHSDGCNSYREIPYGCSRDYIYEYGILWSSSDGSNILPAGEYKFPFTVNIPSYAPPSFQGRYGHVRYYVRTNIDIPWAFDEERMAVFAVPAIVDLNIDRRLSLQANTGATTFANPCCSCKSNPIVLAVSLPRSGYIPGEKVFISVHIVNKTFSKINSVEIKLIKDHVFLGNRYYDPPSPHGHSDSKKWETTEFYYQFQPPENAITSVYDFIVPMISPSFLQCPFIIISYRIVVIVHTNAIFSSGPKVQIPVIIGTVPIQQNIVLPVTPPTPNVSADAATALNKNN